MTLALGLAVLLSSTPLPPDASPVVVEPTSGQITGQVFSSLLLGAGVGLGGALVGLSLSPCAYCALQSASVGGSLGTALGAGAGVLLASALYGLPGNPKLAMLAALVGAVPGVLSSALNIPYGMNMSGLFGWLVTAVLSPTLAVIAYDWKLPEDTRVELHPTNGGVSFAFTTRW